MNTGMPLYREVAKGTNFTKKGHPSTRKTWLKASCNSEVAARATKACRFRGEHRVQLHRKCGSEQGKLRSVSKVYRSAQEFPVHFAF